MSPIQIIKHTVLLCLSFALIACGGGNSGPAGPSDTTNPTALVMTNAPVQPDPNLITTDTLISINFNESMDTTSLVLGGSMATESNGGIWSTTANPNDTLTISPAGNWSRGGLRTLTVDATDLAGNAVTTVNVVRDVYQGTLYYVSQRSGDDGLDGLSPLTAKATISAAISSAALNPPATVLVESGNYLTPITLGVDDVSLYGGYASGFGSRTPGSTQITDTANTATNIVSPHFALHVLATITPTTIVDGFSLNGTTAPNVSYVSAAVWLEGAPTLENANIDGGGNGATSVSIGILNIASGTPVIRHNAIDGGRGGPAYAIYNLNAIAQIQYNRISNRNGYGLSVGIEHDNRIVGGGTLVVEGNLIEGGTSLSSRGVEIMSGHAIVRNNTISGGSGSDGVALKVFAQNMQASLPNIDNNILFTGGGANSKCLEENFPATISSPGSLRNNTFFNCTFVYIDMDQGCVTNEDGDGSAYTCTINEVNALTDISGGVGNNVSLDPQFIDIDGPDNDITTMDDNDWHLSASTPASISAGGLNGNDAGWSFTQDFDGTTRPASGNAWSMGAYEP